MLVLTTTLPIFTLIGLGFFAARWRVLPACGIPTLGAFVTYLALPALLFGALTQDHDHSALQIHVLIVYVVATLTLQFSVTIIAHRYLRKTLREAVILGTGMTHANSALVGLPVGLTLVGPKAIVLLAFYVSFEMVVLFPLMTVLAEWQESAKNDGLPQRLKDVFTPLVRNPLILAILAGLLCKVIALPLPYVLQSVVQQLSSSCVPIALIYIGCVLALQSSGARESRQLVVVAFGKLVLHPAIVALAILLLPNADPLLSAAVIINAGMPLATIFPLLAARYSQRDIWSGAVVLTTLLSFLTLSALITLTGVVHLSSLSVT